MNSSYSEKLKNPSWQKMRLRILDRDKWTCQLCKDTKTTLHVHHKKYEKGKEPWEYPLTNFITLCAHCHTFITDIDGAANPVIYNNISAIKDSNSNGSFFITARVNDRMHLYVRNTEGEILCNLNISGEALKTIMPIIKSVARNG